MNKFTKNQEGIILMLRSEGKSYTLKAFLEEYLLLKNITFEFDESQLPYNIIVHGQEVSKLYVELYDILFIWNYLLRHKFLSRYKDPVHIFYPDHPIPIMTANNTTKDNTLTNMAAPLWFFMFNPSFDFEYFIENDFKTPKELEQSLNEKRLKGERVGRWVANGLTMVAVISSVIFGWINTNKEYSRDLNINKIQRFPDTVKVMYYNPPKDTLKFNK